MKPGLLISTVLPLLAACSIAHAEPAAASAPAASAASASVAAASETPPVAAATVPATSPAAALPAMPAGAPMTMAPTSSAGSLLQTIFALVFVLALLIGLAWFMKRYGPKVMGGNNKMRVVSSLNLGGRERIVLVEVADQWIVVGASPGRINALATMPRQEGELPQLATAQNGPAAANFSEWLKQTIEKRNGK
ncbi:flagellar protein FliO [Janthinobacterium sp. HH103]|uniref:flagellar biosynthetic protein FliO n=1 Tax=unclassified Janthinobacterium TaxID=2610881 RepID=UPI000874ADAD|nr:MULTISPECIES: flagellar biosynthetic protein FliO [unclassified Janthinobacterium]OEZ69636.1 flagellar protein FliO [Janthinobacterium sp. HH100]OEZ79640.1 flagellar protein FliO [Janthinobacterium sp. HH103]PHV39945.1 flagellar biosynthetic protein FliO [Janthinobacterium sp. BJB304]QOU75174.1 Flagellar biosynthesis protein, FliO [Janthinobacterium sp. HH102]